MPKRISKNLQDSNQIAAAVVAISTNGDEREITSRIMAEMGRKGGKIGGKRSLETMTASERSKRAKLAAKARWKAKPKAK